MTDDQGAGDRVRVELLGRFRVVVSHREVGDRAWPGRRSAELVQLLALAEHHRLLRDQVLDALWPHLAPDAAAANLRKAAHHGRQALGREDAVVLSGGRVELFPNDQVETDVEGFERLAEAALRAGDRSTCDAASLACTGVLLPDALYEEWTQARRSHLRARLVELLRVARQWERLVDVEPADEAAHRELMAAALHAGNRHAAIRWYGRLRANLGRELGVQPDEQSQALYQQCVAGLGPAATAFVGRQVELARVEVAIRNAEQDGAGLLVVRGPPGIGKSTLCREVASAAAGRGWRVVTAATAVGARRAHPLVSPPAPADVRLTRHQVIGAVHRLLPAGERAAGVVLVVDDAHHADRPGRPIGAGQRARHASRRAQGPHGPPVGVESQLRLLEQPAT